MQPRCTPALSSADVQFNLNQTPPPQKKVTQKQTRKENKIILFLFWAFHFPPLRNEQKDIIIIKPSPSPVPFRGVERLC
jgi:hypothetical protein